MLTMSFLSRIGVKVLQMYGVALCRSLQRTTCSMLFQWRSRYLQASCKTRDGITAVLKTCHRLLHTLPFALPPYSAWCAGLPPALQ